MRGIVVNPELPLTGPGVTLKADRVGKWELCRRFIGSTELPTSPATTWGLLVEAELADALELEGACRYRAGR